MTTVIKKKKKNISKILITFKLTTKRTIFRLLYITLIKRTFTNVLIVKIQS